MEQVMDEEGPDAREEISGERLRNQEIFQARATEARAALSGMVQALERMERMLVLVDRVLRISQPPKTGKLGVRWWLLRGGESVRRPVLVEWKMLRNGRWRSKRVLRLNKPGKAGAPGGKDTSWVCQDETYRLGVMAGRLIKGYNEVADRLRDTAAGLNRSHWRAQQPLNLLEEQLRFEHGRVTRKLLNAGYDVDVYAMGLIDEAGL